MPWSDAFSSLPPSIKGTVAVFTVVPAIAVISYVVLVMAPAVPAIVEAIKQGRPATLVPLGIGEYEPPSVKKCKLVIENSNDAMRSLQVDLEKSMSLLESQQRNLQNSANKRSDYLQLPSDKIGSMFYQPFSILQTLNNDVELQQNIRDEIASKLKVRIEVAIDYLNRIRDYCLHSD